MPKWLATNKIGFVGSGLIGAGLFYGSTTAVVFGCICMFLWSLD